MIYHRWAPSLGALEGRAEDVWGTTEYEGDRNDPTVFFGLYGLPDFYALWRHKSKKWILWTGSDITHFKNGYWLEEGGEIRLSSKSLAAWINKHCESWVENEVEQAALKELGIEAAVCPSFMGDVGNFPLSYQSSPIQKLYTSVSGDEFTLYGWDKISVLALDNPDIEFHCYGNKSIPEFMIPENMFLHGRIPKERMNEEIRSMQGAIRMTEFDGFSEILAKSVLMGQWPVSLISYPHMRSPDGIGEIKSMPNIEGREYYLNHLNKFPWVNMLGQYF